VSPHRGSGVFGSQLSIAGRDLQTSVGTQQTPMLPGNERDLAAIARPQIHNRQVRRRFHATGIAANLEVHRHPNSLAD